VEPAASAACRDVLDCLRAQVHAHLPPLIDQHGSRVSESVVPLDRLPMLGTVVQQYIEAEAVYANANAPQGPQEGDQGDGDQGQAGSEAGR
jgi:hypothetical protein